MHIKGQVGVKNNSLTEKTASSKIITLEKHIEVAAINGRICLHLVNVNNNKKELNIKVIFITVHF